MEEVDLSPKLPKKVYGCDGGHFYTWSPSELPMLRQANISVGKLVLEKNGFTIPDYSDWPKIAYVLQGSGEVGIVLPEAEKEKVISIRKGDAIPMQLGVVSWWHNKDDTELIILFLGETSKSPKPGEPTDFFLMGSNGMLTGFSTEFLGRALDLEEDKVKLLVGSQTSKSIVKLKKGVSLPEPKKEDRDGIVLNCEEAPADVEVKNGGSFVFLNNQRLPLLGEVGLAAEFVKLDSHAMCSPDFSTDPVFQAVYVVRGSGRFQVVGANGRRVLDTTVKAGCLFIVPRFFVVSKIANEDGLELFSIITNPNTVFRDFGGRTSIFKALSPQVLEAAFNVAPDVVQLFRSKRTGDYVFFPPPN